MPTPFIPKSFDPPRTLKAKYFYFKVLEDSIAELDFEAVMSSQKRLQSIFGPDSEWPKFNMNIEENIASLKAHKGEFELREAFAYSVFNESKTRCLGSVYIDPSQSPNYDCDVYYWIRDDSLALEEELYKTVLNWLQKVWSFSKIAFPGKHISWEDWAKELKVV